MFGKSAETKPISKGLEKVKDVETKISVKDMARRMLDRFYVAIGRTRKEETKGVEEADEGADKVEEKDKKETIFPKKVEDIDLTEYLGGSSGVKAGYFNGEVLVVKKAREVIDEEGVKKSNTGQLVDEYLADRIYEAMGFSVPASKIYDNGRHKVSKFVLGKDLNTFSRFSPDGEKVKKELQKGFVLDCLLANWDVVGGMNGDNIRFGDDGKVYRLDNGGALRFRARGSKKGEGFGEEVGELKSLRKNEFFSDISDEEINRQIDEIVKNRDKILMEINIAFGVLGLPPDSFDELSSVMIKRINYLQKFREQQNKEKSAEKGIYESAVTGKYFEDWSQLELDGNPEIKDQVRENIMHAEKRNQATYEDAARDLGISVEEFKKILQKKIEDVIGRSDFFRATHVGILEKVMNVDGRYKSQFETGRSSGTLSPHYRAAAEMNMFGFNRGDASVADFDAERYYYGNAEFQKIVLDKDKEKRPIYGYFSDEEHGALNRLGKIPPPNMVAQYGGVNIKIKKEVALKKATITFHDSLGPNRDWPPTPAARPHFSSFRLISSGSRVLRNLERSSILSWGESYTEAQYHGQLTMDDIESIHLSTHNGLSIGEIEEVRRIFQKYKESHPESTIELIEF